ncbi:glycoside hydrolase domain-containing protein [Ornithinibacillus xuwenensis]|uniref:Glycoside hydrolase domain-containing protein n=1 Tax=Ornithinibacillus xuwenensis TaxID=3144668 RepID=A0ABU9XHV2_9BACI
MKKYELFTLVSLALVIAIPILFNIFQNNQDQTESSDPTTEEQENNKENANQDNKDAENGGNKEESDKENSNAKIHWGVDSASYTDEEFLGCVVDNYGKPVVWGRYLGDKEDVSTGLDSAEVKRLHDNNIQILIIYNHVEDARGHDNGVDHANQAISMAEELGVPEGVAIFVDIEPSYPVDVAFMEGWYETLADSNYESGVYGVFDEESDILNAYKSMEQSIQENTIVWTAFPQVEITTKENAPEYNSQGPKNSKLYGWQYAIEGEACNIDTNLFKGQMLDYLW